MGRGVCIPKSAISDVYEILSLPRNGDSDRSPVETIPERPPPLLLGPEMSFLGRDSRIGGGILALAEAVVAQGGAGAVATHCL